MIDHFEVAKFEDKQRHPNRLRYMVRYKFVRLCHVRGVEAAV